MFYLPICLVFHVLKMINSRNSDTTINKNNYKIVGIMLFFNKNVNFLFSIITEICGAIVVTCHSCIRPLDVSRLH